MSDEVKEEAPPAPKKLRAKRAPKAKPVEEAAPEAAEQPSGVYWNGERYVHAGETT